MTDETPQEEWFMDEFEKLSGEERLRKLMQYELKDLSGEELQARVEDISEGAEDFVKVLRLSHVRDDGRGHGRSAR